MLFNPELLKNQSMKLNRTLVGFSHTKQGKPFLTVFNILIKHWKENIFLQSILLEKHIR